MMEIDPGTPCFLVRVDETPEWNGRVVHVLGRVYDPDEPGVDWYRIAAGWLEHAYPESDVLVLRENLRPLIPPLILPGIEAGT